MGVDIHEYREQNGLSDPNPAIRRVSRPQGNTARGSRITSWRKKKAAAQIKRRLPQTQKEMTWPEALPG